MAGPKRRIDVMLSSTFLNLKQHREAVIAAINGLQLTPLAQEFDAALHGSDLIKASLDRVEAADVYVGLIGSRYGQRPESSDRNPDCLSLTELEYRRAVARDLPRLMFIMADDHPLTLADLKASMLEGDESWRLQQAFIERVRKDRIAAEFSSAADLKTKATTSLVDWRRSLDKAETLPPPAPPPPSPDDVPPTAAPAFHYVRKPYVEKQGFAGRVTELALIDTWTTGPDAMLLFQAIGGMGKSMLTWHWLRTRAAAVRADWAGRLWYSFYEQGADLNDFCVHALAYIRHVPPKTFRGRRTLDLGDELRRELDARPWLLVLDGLERVLVAYNRAGKEHMTDEDAVVARDGMGLDREPRDCFRPEDDDVLAMLAQASQGKLLASSRLTPTALTNATRQPIPGVTRLALEGLAPDDAEEVLRKAGVRGDGWRMRRFLADNFGCHPLSVGAVAGQVMTFLERRGDFDRWVEHPKGGADPALIGKDVRGRQNRILSRAFENLGDDEKALLGSIAMAGIELTPDILRILNPKCPIEPRKVDSPKLLGDEDYESHEHWSLKFERDHAELGETHATAQKKLDAYRKRNFAKQQERYDAYVAAHTGWEQKAREADAWLAAALPNLEERGLLQYDTVIGSLDMHPAIRHTALIGLSPEVRDSTGTHVSDALSTRPTKPFAEARALDDLSLAMTRVEALNAASKFKAAWQLLSESGLHGVLLRLQYPHELLELTQPWFPNGWEQGPVVLPRNQHRWVLSEVASSLHYVGKSRAARILQIRSIKIALETEAISAIDLNNLSSNLELEGEYIGADRVRSLGIRFAEADHDSDTLLALMASQAIRHIDRGNLTDAEAILIKLRQAAFSSTLDPGRETQILRTDLSFAFRFGCLNEAMAERCLARIRSLRDRIDEGQSLAIIARWRQVEQRHKAAIDTFGDLIALANETGSPYLPAYEARRALSLAALGRRDEAWRVTRKVDHGETPPHVALALLYLELGDRAKAREHALAGYKKAWGQGPPYHDHWDLLDCRKTLKAIGEPEPVLPVSDPSKIEPFDFEPEVERLIDKKLAERAKRDAAAKRAKP